MIGKLHIQIGFILLLSLMSYLGHGASGYSLPEASEPGFHKVEAQKGDGMYSLLRRYKIKPGSCNMNKFLELNKLEPNQALVVGRSYYIPVYIYQYNGKSIRTTIGNNDLDKALRIKSYNEYLQAQNLRKTSYLDSRILWVPYDEIACQSNEEAANPVSAVEPGVKTRYEPLFGEKLAAVPLEDESLKNKVFYVVSGHGGPDPGAQCDDYSTTLCEDEYAYDVALRLARNLMQHGAIVYMMIQDKNDGIRSGKFLPCDKDELSINKKRLPLNQKKRLKQRTDDINRLYANHKRQGIKSQTVISIHVDSRSHGKRQDVFFYHLKGSKTGKRIANRLQKTFSEKYQKFQKNRGYKGTVKDRNLYLLRNTHPTAVFVELANIKNSHDHKRLLIEANRQALANWLYEGLAKSVD